MLEGYYDKVKQLEKAVKDYTLAVQSIQSPLSTAHNRLEQLKKLIVQEEAHYAERKTLADSVISKAEQKADELTKAAERRFKESLAAKEQADAVMSKALQSCQSNDIRAKALDAREEALTKQEKVLTDKLKALEAFKAVI